MWSISETATHKAFLIAVKKRRDELNIPQKQIAHELRLTQSAYSRIECGSSDLKFADFIFLCKRLNLNAQEFLM